MSKNLADWRHKINEIYLEDENKSLSNLLKMAKLSDNTRVEINRVATALVEAVRKERTNKGGLDAFLTEYDLSSEEGVALMCLAEAMLRIPDSETANDLIRDKITSANWSENRGKSDSFFVNASTWALMLTGKMISDPKKKSLSATLKKMLQSTSSPIIRTSVGQAMKILGKQFVMGRSIQEATKRAKVDIKKGYTHSYDMLGEAARTQNDADRYFESYANAITALSAESTHDEVEKNPGISVKLSALHPRYEFAKKDDVIKSLVGRVKSLALQAKASNVGFTIDAEEARVLDLSLDIFEAVYRDPMLDGWTGFGLALQSYQKRAHRVIDWLVDLQKQVGRRIMLRLIKGAYWDAEIKYAQEQGSSGYPVFTRKASTDVSFLACAKKILSHPTAFFAQFGTHNAYSVAAILTLTGERRDFEFQCLHGMGNAMYDSIISAHHVSCRIYAPVGTHKNLLAYLVRRLLENGANTSFVNRIADTNLPISQIVADPVVNVQALHDKPHPKIPLPLNLFGDVRQNARGFDFSNREALSALLVDIQSHQPKGLTAASVIYGKSLMKKRRHSISSPSDVNQVIGQVSEAGHEEVNEAFVVAEKAFTAWCDQSVQKRASCLLKMADLLEDNTAQCIALLNHEAGRTLVDCISEVREAVDFCRYYANQAMTLFESKVMPGPTGEINTLSVAGRGVMVCISPWNFPLAIFLGQVVAALVAGNCVIAKPAEQTPFIANFALSLLFKAGIPKGVLQLLLGTGERVGRYLTSHPKAAGVLFTGSTEAAHHIHRALAEKPGPIVPLIAETGGLNCMIVDSSALLEQVVVDVMSSAFGSAGQRCSALRVLYVQSDIADELITMLTGAMQTLQVGDPLDLATDVGPVIDQAALELLEMHVAKLSKTATKLFQVKLSKACQNGHFFAPCAFEIEQISQLKSEVFGPILHVIRFKQSNLGQVIDDINGTGYGLTHGIHSRINDKVEMIASRIRSGNVYVNRNMIGAVVGVQPFGGEGLSGTGPKAGGPHYLSRLVVEHTLTINTTASGGNASLLTLDEHE
jgi:RHH-type transcriptional regulator, proline utilization regulon repressor / proline dehydrogenase / delta 1-pyrroline-5-carboxylate dehydrogenase